VNKRTNQVIWGKDQKVEEKTKEKVSSFCTGVQILAGGVGTADK
jgi:hypothetical protein